MTDGFVIIHLLGAVQGLFLAAVLLSGRRRSAANGLLAALMVAFAVDLGVAAYHGSGLDAAAPHLIGLDVPLAFLYGPLLYLYARTLTRPAAGLRRADLWHAAPFVIAVGLLLPFLMQSGAEKLAVARGTALAPWSGLLGAVHHAKMAHVLAYLAATLVLLRRTGGAQGVHQTWLRHLMKGIVAMAVFAIGWSLLAGQGTRVGLDPETTADDYTLLLLAVFVYAIGFLGLRQPEVFDGRWHGAAETRLPEDGQPEDGQPEDGQPEDVLPEEVLPEGPQYARSGMDAEAARRYRDVLVEQMTDARLYRRGDLTLQDLADAAGLTPHNVTEVLSTQLGASFYAFVNGYRVREVQARLADPEAAHLTVLAIGLEAGFNSKSAFNAAFKRHTGMTPSQYRTRAGAAKPS